ncbi:ABC transporter permease [Microbacterium aurugineum]|uniref:ABC transporter permease n=1 Tax=Microbacterium aurugineum TaxID=2851642 RepID=UPI0020BFA965|nr:ABC transporter permease [Microbacterium aurugineum]MCK8475948.1 ABC transporter permease [Microbacterium aurugineum]
MTSILLPRVRRRRRSGSDLGFWISCGFLTLIAVAAAFAPLLAPYEADSVDFAAIWEGPSAQHLLGTDQLGRDLFSRLLIGAGETLVGPVVLLVLATILGVAIGVLAAWRGGWIDTVLARVTDVMFAFPGLLFVVLVIAVFGKGPATAIVALALAYAPVIAKYTRSLALSEMTRPYIDAYRVQGLGGLTICLRGVIPNLLPPLVGYLVVLFGEALMSLATLSFLGFGAQPPSSEWGLMVQEGQPGIIQGEFLPTLVPGAAIALVVIAVNVAGVRVADRLLAKG